MRPSSTPTRTRRNCCPTGPTGGATGPTGPTGGTGPTGPALAGSFMKFFSGLLTNAGAFLADSGLPIGTVVPATVAINYQLPADVSIGSIATTLLGIAGEQTITVIVLRDGVAVFTQTILGFAVGPQPIETFGPHVFAAGQTLDVQVTWDGPDGEQTGLSVVLGG